MTADGLSLPTTIAQAGDVARAQVKAQQTHQPSAPASEQLAQSRDTKVQRVQKAPGGERRRVQADDERRRQPRQGRREGEPESQAAPEAVPNSTANARPAEPSAEEIGLHIDTRV